MLIIKSQSSTIMEVVSKLTWVLEILLVSYFQFSLLYHKNYTLVSSSLRILNAASCEFNSGIAGNHWNGYSKGSNKRSGKTGLYPGFKTVEKVETAKFDAFKTVRWISQTKAKPDIFDSFHIFMSFFVNLELSERELSQIFKYFYTLLSYWSQIEDLRYISKPRTSHLNLVIYC